MSTLKIQCLTLLLLLSIVLKAQQTQLYTYQQLSKTYYAFQKDSLKKAWVCPDAFKNKATQKKYKEIWDSRTEFIAAAIEDQDFIFEPEVCNYIQSIVDQICNSNSKLISKKPFVLIDRSSAVNAYAIGGNVLAVNLGLIDFARTREEVALVIAHEMAHNLLNHIDNLMRERAEWLTSEEFKQSVNSVLDSKYERYSRLTKVLENYKFDRSRHQRYHESDADSFAVVLLKNSKIPFHAEFFLRLDSTDLQYKQALKQPLKNYFTGYDLPFEDGWTKQRSKGLSTRNYNFKDTTSINDSLKTHPDCPQRYEKTRPFSDVVAKNTPVPGNIKYKVSKMIIWNIFDNAGLTACLYRILQQKDKGVQDEWYVFMLNNVFNALCYHSKELHRFLAIGIMPKELISADYYALQTMLEQMPQESLVQYCKVLHAGSFWSSRPEDEKALRALMYTIAIDPDDSERNRRSAAETFVNDHSTSLYCEFADHFKKK